MAASAAARGTGIVKRTPEYIEQKIDEGKAVIAITDHNEWVGFCYIETWSHGEYVANSGLIVAPEFRKSGVAKSIKKKIFDLSRQKYPTAKIFGHSLRRPEQTSSGQNGQALCGTLCITARSVYIRTPRHR